MNKFIVSLVAIMLAGCATVQKAPAPPVTETKTEAQVLCDDAQKYVDGLEGVMNKQLSSTNVKVNTELEHCSEVKFDHLFIVYTMSLIEKGMPQPFAHAGFLLELRRGDSGEFEITKEPVVLFENAMPENMSLQQQESILRQQREDSI